MTNRLTQFLPLRPRALSLTALLATALAATSLLLVRGPSCGHDFDFHFVSWLEVARAWHGGLFYPHWAESANFGAGEPRFIFYPPASWMLGAALGSIAGWHATPWLFTASAMNGTVALAVPPINTGLRPSAAIMGAVRMDVKTPNTGGSPISDAMARP